jgi:hypothetical protein
MKCLRLYVVLARSEGVFADSILDILDPEKQEVFIAEYEALRSTLLENEEIYFIDAVHHGFQSKAVCE